MGLGRPAQTLQCECAPICHVGDWLHGHLLEVARDAKPLSSTKCWLQSAFPVCCGCDSCPVKGLALIGQRMRRFS